jgi:small subunit ribosomal protein S17
MSPEKKEAKKPAARKSAAKTEKAAPAAREAAPAAAKTAQVDPRNGLERRRVIVGTVVSDKMQKTIVVKVDRRVRHGMYKKYLTMSRRFKAHDETNQAKVGDLVTLVESRPLSREKRWALQSIVRRAGQTPDANV